MSDHPTTGPASHADGGIVKWDLPPRDWTDDQVSAKLDRLAEMIQAQHHGYWWHPGKYPIEHLANADLNAREAIWLDYVKNGVRK